MSQYWPLRHHSLGLYSPNIFVEMCYRATVHRSNLCDRGCTGTVPSDSSRNFWHTEHLHRIAGREWVGHHAGPTCRCGWSSTGLVNRAPLSGIRVFVFQLSLFVPFITNPSNSAFRTFSFNGSRRGGEGRYTGIFPL